MIFLDSFVIIIPLLSGISGQVTKYNYFTSNDADIALTLEFLHRTLDSPKELSGPLDIASNRRSISGYRWGWFLQRMI